MGTARHLAPRCDAQTRPLQRGALNLLETVDRVAARSAWRLG
jgi:hypothetical protein